MSNLGKSVVPRWALAVALTVTLAAAGCGGNGSTKNGASGAPGPDGAGVVPQSVYDAAPVAAASDIPAGSIMAKIRDRGHLAVGGALDAPLLSQQNPVSGKVEGFDADLAKLLAKYII